MHKHRRDISSYTYYLSLATVETGLTRVTRVNATPEKFIPKKKKYIKSLALYPFIPVNKILLNKENDHNPETTDNSRSEKYNMSHTSRDYCIENRKTQKTLMMMTNTKMRLRNIKTVMNLLIILKLQTLCVMIVLSRQSTKKKHWLNG